MPKTIISVSEPPPHHKRRSPSRRRQLPPTRRNLPSPQRRTLFRRTTRIQAKRIRSTAATHGRKENHHIENETNHRLPGRLHVSRRYESLSVRLLQPPHPALHLRHGSSTSLPEQNIRPITRQNRHTTRSSPRTLQGTNHQKRRRNKRRDKTKSTESEENTRRTLQRQPRDTQQRTNDHPTHATILQDTTLRHGTNENNNGKVATLRPRLRQNTESIQNHSRLGRK